MSPSAPKGDPSLWPSPAYFPPPQAFSETREQTTLNCPGEDRPRDAHPRVSPHPPEAALASRGFLTSHPISIAITNSAPLLHKPHFEDLIATWGQRPPDRTAETPSLFIRVQSPRAQSFYTEFGGRRFSCPSLCSRRPCRPNKLEERRLTEEPSLPVSEEGLSKSLRGSPVLCTQKRRCGEDEVGILPSGSFPDLMKGARPC